MRKRSQHFGNEKRSLNTRLWQPGCDITLSLGPLSVEDMYVRGAGMKAPSGMFVWDVAWLINGAGIMWGATEVRAMAPVAAILTFGQQLAVFYIVVISAAP